jgi:hypothetical protein
MKREEGRKVGKNRKEGMLRDNVKKKKKKRIKQGKMEK